MNLQRHALGRFGGTIFSEMQNLAVGVDDFQVTDLNALENYEKCAL